MVDIFPTVITRQYREKATDWLLSIRRSEHASILFFHMADRFWRIQQFLEDIHLHRKVLGRQFHYRFLVADFNRSLIEEQQDLTSQIARRMNLEEEKNPARSFDACLFAMRRRSQRLVLVIPQGEKYLNAGDRHILEHYSWLNQYSPDVTMLVFYNCDITHPDFSQFLPEHKVLYDTMSYFPLYDALDTRKFLHTLAGHWGVALDGKTERSILAAFGGHFWLVKEALRQADQTGRWLMEADGMQFRLDQVYASLLPSELSLLRKLVARGKEFTELERHSLGYLRKMRVVDNRNRLLLSAFGEYLLERQETQGNLGLLDGKIVFNGVPLTRFFTRQEYRVMNLLLEKRGTLVSRDAVASAIWPTNTAEHYSDWAIDALVARLRRRLAELSLPPQFIESVRGKGYRVKA